jgi:hypothetical protein
MGLIISQNPKTFYASIESIMAAGEAGDLSTPLNKFKGVVSSCLLIFSLTIVMGLIFNNQTKLSDLFHPVMGFLVIWAALIWLMMVEGSQASLVGLAPVKPELIKDTHLTTYKLCKFIYEGDNFHRYLLGRQFMVVLLVFCINSAGSPLKDADLWGLPEIIKKIFLVSGLAMILFTANIGQLPPQVVSSKHMCDFINNRFATFTVYVAMAIEFSGLLHASYVCSYIIHGIAGKPVESNEPPKAGFTWIFFWTRCLMSCALLGYCFAVTLTALFASKTTMWEGVPPGVSVILFFVFMTIVGLLEGMQIAFFAVAKIRKEERGSSFFAKKTCELLFRGEGYNLPGFMIGRQLCVVANFFIIARVTSLDIAEGETNVFGVSDTVQSLFNTGLLGALITTIVGSISWQLLASAFPIAFLSSPFTYIFLRICLMLEASGICHGAWVIGAVLKKVMGAQLDEVYIGTADERAAKDMADNDENLHLGAGHIYKLPGFVDNAPAVLKDLIKNDPSVAEYLGSMSIQMGTEDKKSVDTESEDMDC